MLAQMTVCLDIAPFPKGPHLLAGTVPSTQEVLDVPANVLQVQQERIMSK